MLQLLHLVVAFDDSELQ